MAYAEIVFSEKQQIALLGHSVVEQKIFEAATDFGVTKEWFVNPNAVKVWSALSDFVSSHHRLPTVEELKSQPIFIREDLKIKEACLRALDLALASRVDIGYDTLVTALREWSVARSMRNTIEKTVDYWNRGDINLALGEFKEGFVNVDRIDQRIAEVRLQDAPTRVLIERQERLVQKNSIMSYGVIYLDEATGGIRPNDLVLIGAKAGSGKCLGLGTQVMKYDGACISVENVVVGDLLMGPDSKPRKVLSTTRDRGPMFRIVPVKGDPWICNDVHVLTLTDTRDGVTRDIPLNKLLKENKTYRKHQKQISTGVDFNKYQDLPIDPYFIGLWFGDGAKSCKVTGKLDGVRITSIDPEIIESIKMLAKTWGLRFRTSGIEHFVISNQHNTRDPQNNKLLTALRELVGVGESIPQSYLTSSRQDRLQLLAGLIDSDGSLSANCFDWSQKSKKIFDGFVFLARSLGLRVTTALAEKSDQNGTSGLYWRACISGNCDIVPTRVARKKARPRRQKKNVLRTGIDVESIGVGEYAGFELDGDGRFLLSDFTITHNTQLVTRIAEHNALAGKRVVVFSLEAERGEIERRIKYGLIAKAYGIWIRNNPNVNARAINYRLWRDGMMDDVVGKFEDGADRSMKAYKNLSTLYRLSGEYGVNDLERDIVRVAADTDLILIDHLQYIDIDDTNNENAGVKKIVKKLRDLALVLGKPIVLVSHLKKTQGGRKYAPIVAELEDFHGTSDIVKIATTAIILAPCYEPKFVHEEQALRLDDTYATYFRIPKCRVDGTLVRYTGIAWFDSTTGRYRPEYAVGHLVSGDCHWEQSKKKPHWAKSGSILLRNTNDD